MKDEVSSHQVFYSSGGKIGLVENTRFTFYSKYWSDVSRPRELPEGLRQQLFLTLGEPQPRSNTSANV